MLALTMTPEQRLLELGFTLPEAPAPVAAYVPAVRTGDLIFVSGQLPFENGALAAQGRVPDEVTIDQAVSCARLSALNAMAVLAAQLDGGLSDVAQIVRIGVFVQCEPGFGGQPAIANGASELLVEVFGDSGRHARAAVGSIGLPLNAPVEIEMIARVR
jgi:enamine deaminase RidA (YjgF/YER057c/UK114 family)